MAKRKILGSEMFNTEVMKADEVVLFIQAAVKNGATLEEAYEDMQAIDAMLYMTRLHVAAHHHVKRTSAGHLRKGTELYRAYEAIIEGRLQLQKEKTNSTQDI